jgi:tetratricopeptide (TPR) repeat protein
LLGTEHPEVAGTAASLGFWLIDVEAYAEAEALLRESLEIRRRALGEEHPDTAGSLTVLANLMLATERYEEALAFAQQAQDVLAGTMPDGHWRVAMAANVRGLAMAGLGEFAAAEPVLLQSLPGLEQAPVPDLAARGKASMVKFYQAWGRPEEAKIYSQ